MNISVTYNAKWQLKNNNRYVWTECKKLVNVSTGREIKKTLHGMTPGYWINRRFIKLDDIRDNVELIPKVLLPF